LSFTNSKEALEVAARENATSERSVFELKDLLQKIALQDKVNESREFATKVNGALYRVWGQAGATRNRGVKKAPFIVLIGASMPSVLAEIGFLSNPKDELEMKKPETRRKIAEALYKGIAQYAETLSHFNVAAKRDSGKQTN
jgi:N-acetylmuramoyl-L-alanine amidase